MTVNIELGTDAQGDFEEHRNFQASIGNFMKYFRTVKLVKFSQIFFLLMLIACGGSESKNSNDKQNSKIAQKDQPSPEPPKEQEKDQYKELEGEDPKYASIDGTIEVLKIIPADSPSLSGVDFKVYFNFIIDGQVNDPKIANEISQQPEINESATISVKSLDYRENVNVLDECLTKYGIVEGARIPGLLLWHISGGGSPYVHQFKNNYNEKCIY